MQSNLSKTFSDILSRDVLPFVLLVGIGSVIVWIVPLWWIWGGVVHGIEWLAGLTSWTQSWQHLEGADSFWTAFKIGYVLVTITVSIATAIWGEKILRRLARKHYPHLAATGSGKIHRSLYYNLKANGKFLLLLLVTFPLLFIPYLGKLWLLYLWSIQIKEPTVYDVGALLDMDTQTLRQHTRQSRWISLLAAALNFIPIVNFFVPLFAQILFLHAILDTKA